MPPRMFHFAALMGLIAVSAGCGGGGGGGGGTPVSAPAPAPVLTLTPAAIKVFRFAWNDVSGTTEYRLLEDPDGSSGYTTVATLGPNARDYNHSVFLAGRINARYILQACAGSVCLDSAPVHVTGTLVAAIGYVKASNTGGTDEFGYALALSADGNTLVVGAFHEDSDAIGTNGDGNNDLVVDSGAVYVFTNNGGVWSQQAYLKASNTGAVDRFGRAVALSADGNTLAVGASAEDSSAQGVGGNQTDNAAPNSGAVYVFARAGSAWSQTAYVKASNTHSNMAFGATLGLSADGTALAVGAPGENSASTGVGGDQANELAVGSGAVYLFSLTGGAWTQHAYIKASNTGSADRFGLSLSLASDGNTLAVGTTSEDSSAVGINGDQGDATPAMDYDGGAVYVFARMGSDWSQQAYVKASDTHLSGRFGAFVALSADGNTLAASTFDATTANAVGGVKAPVYVFVRLGSSWTQEARLTGSTYISSLSVVALTADGNTLAVGNPGDAGRASGLRGDTTFVPAPNDPNGLVGAAFVFTRTGGVWREQAYIKASNAGPADLFGESIAISADGKTLAVGAHWEGSDATGINGDGTNDQAQYSGAAYLY